MNSVRAIIFDFNGTLSDDEPILCEIYRDLFAGYGRPLSAQQYFDELAGHSEEEIMRRWLGPDVDLESAVAERIARYRATVRDGSSIGEPVRAAVRYAAEHVPLAIVSGAARAEIEPVVEAAGLAPFFRATVSADEVVHGKPHPEGYLRALELLGDDLQPGHVIAFEDTEAGVSSAKAAGMRCIAVRGTLEPERLRAADELVAGITPTLLHSLLDD